MLPGDHPSLQPSDPFRGAWITELARHVQRYCYARVTVAEAVKPQLLWPVSTACIIICTSNYLVDNLIDCRIY